MHRNFSASPTGAKAFSRDGGYRRTAAKVQRSIRRREIEPASPVLAGYFFSQLIVAPIPGSAVSPKCGNATRLSSTLFKRIDRSCCIATTAATSRRFICIICRTSTTSVHSTPTSVCGIGQIPDTSIVIGGVCYGYRPLRYKVFWWGYRFLFGQAGGSRGTPGAHLDLVCL